MNNISTKTLLFYLTSFFIYLLNSFFIWGFPIDSLSRIVLGTSGDPFQFIWGIKWGLYAFMHGINPIISFKTLYPVGANLAWSAGNSFTVDFLSLPITYIYGAIFSYNMWVLLSPVLAAMSALSLNYYLTRKYFPSFVGAYVYGFSSYEMGQLLGHLNLFSGIFIIPIIVLILLMFYQGKISKTLLVFSIVICLILLFGFSLEIFTSFTLFSYASIFIALAFYKEYKDKILKLLIYFTLSYMITSIILIPYFYYILIGLPFVPKAFNSASVYSADLLNYIIPTPITYLGGDFFSHISQRFPGNYSEEGAYLGIPLIIVFFIYLKKINDSIYKKFILTVLLVIWISSFGPYLHILGHHVLASPYWIITEIPIIANLLPTRFTLYIFLIFSIISGITISKIENKLLKYILSFAIILFLFPNFKFYSRQVIQKVDIPSFFNHNICKKYIKPDSNVLILPFGYFAGNFSALYQEKANMYFNMTDNVSIIVPFKKWPWQNSSLLQSLFEDTPSLLDKTFFRTFVASNKIDYVILTDKEYRKWNRLIDDSFNSKPKYIEGIYLYKVPYEILNDKEYQSYDAVIKSYNLYNFNKLFKSVQDFLSSGQNSSHLYPKYLEEHGYLDKGFGYQSGKANNWTQNGGWIGKWPCPDGKGECFGIGIIGDIDSLKPIIDEYKSQALQIFFPYPKIYKENSKEKSGQLLMIFRAPTPKPATNEKKIFKK